MATDALHLSRVAGITGDLGRMRSGCRSRFENAAISPAFSATRLPGDQSTGYVPTLVDGDSRMTESCAIAHYLAAKGGAASLIVGPDEANHAEYLDLTYHADATITFPQAVYLRFAKFEADKGLEDAGHAYAKWFGKRLVKVDNRLGGRDFLCAGRFTVADICVGYALYLAKRIGLGEHLSPRLLEYLHMLTERNGFRAALALEKAGAQMAGVSQAV